MKDELEKLYIQDNRSTRYIGKVYGKSREWARRRLKEYDISIRHGGDAVKTQWINNDKRRKEQSEFGKNNLVRHKEEHPLWNGGIYKSRGYIFVYCPDHPRVNKRPYMRQHILIIEAHLQRYLNYYGQGNDNNEVVHHINGIRDDNRIENLQLMTAKEHNILHGKLKRGVE